jgi:hypothetical protein
MGEEAVLWGSVLPFFSFLGNPMFIGQVVFYKAFLHCGFVWVKILYRLGVVAQACNPSYKLGFVGGNPEDENPS